MVVGRPVGKLVDSKEITPKNLRAGGLLPGNFFTSHQEGMVARKTVWNLKAAKANAEHGLKEKRAALASLERKVERESARLAGLEGPRSPLEKLSGFESRKRDASSLRARLEGWGRRSKTLQAEIDDLCRQILSGRIKKVFGGKKLASQRMLAGLPPDRTVNGMAPAHASVGAWSLDWLEAREGNWLFEGDAMVAGANKSVKGEGMLGLGGVAEMFGQGGELSLQDVSLARQAELGGLGIKIRLSEEQARARLSLLCSESGVKWSEASNISNRKYSAMRVQSEWAHAQLSPAKDARQQAKLLGLLAALKRDGKGRCAHPIRWRIQFRDGVPYARAQWGEDPEVSSDRKNGIIGVDVNGDHLAWAVCVPDGNKPSAKKGWAKDRPWSGKVPLELEGLGENQATHRIRVAVKKIAEMAGAWGMPVAVESLDFAKKKAGIGRGNAVRARQLSSFAYGAVLGGLALAVAKAASQVLRVDPAFTSVAGWAKYGGALGLCPDRAAAFAIARKAMLSREGRGEMALEKIRGKWVAKAKRHEKVPAAMMAAADPQGRLAAAEVEKAAEAVKKAEAHGGAVAPPTEGDVLLASGAGRRSMVKTTMAGGQGLDSWVLWKNLSACMGRDRRLWGRNLKANVRKRTQGAPKCGRPDGGQGDPSVEGGLATRGNVPEGIPSGISTDLANG